MIRCAILAVVLIALSYCPASAAHNRYGGDLYGRYPYYGGHSLYGYYGGYHLYGHYPYHRPYSYHSPYSHYGHNPYCR